MDDWLLWLPTLAVVAVVCAFHLWMRSIARREIRNELKGWVLSKAIQPRDKRGRFTPK